ncbi:N-6 DNA methylase [Mobiluncus mulieris]|uniref:SAM-dependent DNA methyltransferase n=1 Tax=Mobiluncus mulieris TaxID=2052 RepID=A0ABD4TYM9_9ACTO|nr:N-6 DNA methylase [Mobiluncus mulieris]MCU9969475.1 SAM-dependent DNA methyltransferase [Mobiluncus mulieris]MCU9973914.1 SAM-dependent DNA methyltransferase [Mobiluncus mulieris]MCV0009913.1 SAM-dependent DNA methyltransferase [Mobiluncus mulieris]MCV0013985.1 SAM-dependent DNA methyltransferase [Mobiluncus mulieris]NMW75625.1 SAM-dependent DNA methyltransferase [Mobiluncus mulieris]
MVAREDVGTGIGTGERRFSPTAVTRVIARLQAPTKTQTRRNWLRAVAARTTRQRPDLASDLLEILGIEPHGLEPQGARMLGTEPQDIGSLDAEPLGDELPGDEPLDIGVTPPGAAQLGAKSLGAKSLGDKVSGAEPLGSVVSGDDTNPLEDLSIGEIAVCYEALLATLDSRRRRSAGQFFTPDDAAAFMAAQSRDFPAGTWLDPCCGVGNLAWHLVAAQSNPARFVRENLVLIDVDETALRSAVALLGADFLSGGDHEGLAQLWAKASNRDFLSKSRLAPHEFVIVNPPYARAKESPGLECAASREYFAYFLEKIAKTSRGFIAVTPASYLCVPKFAVLRGILEREQPGGRVFVFDNVPDTLFRGYKFGSNNTSSTNFVRAAITVCSPGQREWLITPILRWKNANRPRIFELAPELLVPREKGPTGEWVKLPADLRPLWHELSLVKTTLRDLLASGETPYALTVATTPRYYISAVYRDLQRGSKVKLYFPDAVSRDRAAVVLNSSLPYLWWRALDGGVTLPRRVLLGTPIPVESPLSPEVRQAARVLEDTETQHLVTKLNAGKINENVKRPPALVERLNTLVFAPVATAAHPVAADAAAPPAHSVIPDFSLLYTEDMTDLL